MEIININEYEEAFNRRLLERGGRFDIDLLPESDRAYFYMIKAYMQENIDRIRTNPEGIISNMPYVHFDFINNPVLNATAFAFEGKEFIGFNYGLVLMVLELFNRILANPGVFPNIGNKDLEIILDKLPTLTADFDVIGDEYDERKFSPYVYPVDESRKEFANYLANFGLLFLLLHEIAHLRFGHIEYINKEKGFSFLMEFDQDIAQKIDPLTNKLLEWNADCWAIEMGTNTACMYAKMGHFNPDILKSVDPLVEIFSYWLIVVSVLFRFSASVRRRFGLGPPEHYPSAQERFFSAVIMSHVGMVEFSKENGGEIPLDEYLKLSNILVNDSEKYLELIFDYEPDLSDLIDYIEESKGLESDFFGKFKEDFREKVRPGLVNFTRASDLDTSEGT